MLSKAHAIMLSTRARRAMHASIYAAQKRMVRDIDSDPKLHKHESFGMAIDNSLLNRQCKHLASFQSFPKVVRARYGSTDKLFKNMVVRDGGTTVDARGRLILLLAPELGSVYVKLRAALRAVDGDVRHKKKRISGKKESK